MSALCASSVPSRRRPRPRLRLLHSLLPLPVRVAGACALFALTGCASPAPEDAVEEEATGTIRAIDAPASVAADEALTITVRGVAGPDLCWELARIDRERSDERLVLTAIVESSEGEGMVCGQAISEFERELRIPPPFRPGTFELLAGNDGEAEVLASVEVR